jgi:hypothetical protein
MRGFYFPGGFNIFGAIIVDVLAGLVFIICLAVVVALLVLLVRFLLVATKAAQIYVDKNSGDRNAVNQNSAATTDPTPPAPAPTTTPTTAAADTAPTLPVVTKGPTKPRGPKKN